MHHRGTVVALLVSLCRCRCAVVADAFRGLGVVADVAQSAVAHRYHDDPKRHKRRAVGEQPRQKAAGAGGSTASSLPSLIHKPAPYVTFVISDSESRDYIRNGGAPSVSKDRTSYQ